VLTCLGQIPLGRVLGEGELDRAPDALGHLERRCRQLASLGLD